MTAAHRYRELRPLAHGGMATLSLAERDDGETVVIKRVRPPFDHDAVYRGLFRDEGEVCASLSSGPGASEHIVRLLDRGEDELGPYLVFEHVEGTDLGVVLEARFHEGRGLDLPAFFAVALPLCDALAAAHEAKGDDGAPLGLVHRDVSPGNVLLSTSGDVKLADFGVALSRLKTEHTVAGEMKGKFAYMAPEQTRAVDVDARADVFAAGIVLYEALAGRRLFDGPTDADVVHAVRETEAPRLDALSADVSPALADVVARMLAKDPSDRPSDMRAVREALYEEASALCLERGLKGHVARLAHAHPRAEPDEHPHVTELRRRTQRVVQAGPAVVVREGGSRVRLVVALALAVVVGVGAAALWPRPVTASDDEGGEPAVAVDAALRQSEAEPKPEVKTRDDGRTEGERSEATTTEGSRSEGTRSEGTRSEGTRSEGTRSDGTGTEPSVVKRPRPKRQRARAEATPAPQRGYGTLILESDPWANVLIDGEPLGQHTPLLGLRLPAGRHAVTLENPVYGLTRTIHVDIRPTAETRRFVDLTKR